jgi:ribonuclease Z
MTSITITLLGTTAGVPTRARNHAAIHVSYKGREEWNGLFDCGEGTQRQIFLTEHVNFMRISDIFISHWHADHFIGLPGLLQTMSLEQRQPPLKVYGPECRRWMDMILNLGYQMHRFPVLAHDVEFHGTEIAVVLDTEEFQVLSIPTKHGVPAVSYAFVEKDRVKIDVTKATKLGLPEKGVIYKKIKEKGEAEFKGKKVRLADIMTVEKGKKIVYSGDTLPSKTVVKLAQNADLLIHDSTLFEDAEAMAAAEKDFRHATFDEVLKIAKEANVKQLVLTHISRRYQDTKELEDEIAKHKNVRLGKDFMKIVLE